MNNIKILLKKPREPESLILMVYRFAGKKLVMSINEKVLTKHWNFDKMMVRANSSYPDHQRLNYTIANWTKALEQAITHFEQKGVVPSMLELKNKTLEIRFPSQNISTGVSNKVVFELEKYIKSLKEENRLSKGVIQSFNQLLNNLKSFKNSSSLEFVDLDLLKLKEFTKYLNDKGYSQGQVNKLQRRLCQLLKYMKSLKVTIDESYLSKSWRLSQPKVSGNELALSQKEIELIEKVQLNESLEKVRDRFLIGIYTGQRFSDFKNLCIDELEEVNGQKVLKIRQNKTSTLINIPFTSKIRAIFKKHKGNPPKVSEPFFNRSIKTICEIAGITDEIKVDRQANNKIETELKRKCDIISSHTCRRTFVTLAIQAGLPLSEVQKVSGHKNLKTLSQYMKGGLEMNSESNKLYESLFSN